VKTHDQMAFIDQIRNQKYVKSIKIRKAVKKI